MLLLAIAFGFLIAFIILYGVRREAVLLLIPFIVLLLWEAKVGAFKHGLSLAFGMAFSFLSAIGVGLLIKLKGPYEG